MKNLSLNEATEVGGGQCTCYGKPDFKPGSQTLVAQMLKRATTSIGKIGLQINFAPQDLQLLNQVMIPKIIRQNEGISKPADCRVFCCREMGALNYMSGPDNVEGSC